PIRALKPAEPPLTLLEPVTTSGYYHVRTQAGERGWVWGNNVSVTTSVDPKRVCRLNRGSSVRWNRGGHHRHDKQHQADGDEHDRIVQIADRPPGDNLVEPHAQCETSEEARDDGQDRPQHRGVDDAPATGTERQTDAKFLEPARHGVRHDTVEPDDCE